MSGYGGDHLDFRGGEFKGPFTAKAEYREHAPAPSALDALPARAVGFTGREPELRELLDAFDPSAASGPCTAPEAVVVAAVSGLGGIGKTALAVEAGHEARGKGWFPGGVLFVDLHGYDEEPVTAGQALEALLRALGTEPEHIPAGEDARAALYRSALAARGSERGPVLILADNASSPAQVRPLLPGGAGHRLLVTSRDRLPQLGARLLALGELTPVESYDLLDRALRIARPADSRVADDLEEAAHLAALCGHLPLALQIAAALLVVDPDKPVVELTAELAASRDLLGHLNDGERDVRAAFDLSYRRLPPEQARVLRLLALAPGPDASDEVVAASEGGGVGVGGGGCMTWCGRSGLAWSRGMRSCGRRGRLCGDGCWSSITGGRMRRMTGCGGCRGCRCRSGSWTGRGRWRGWIRSVRGWWRRCSGLGRSGTRPLRCGCRSVWGSIWLGGVFSAT